MAISFFFSEQKTDKKKEDKRGYSVALCIRVMDSQ